MEAISETEVLSLKEAKNTEMSELAARRATKAISETEELSPKEAQTTPFQFKPKSF
jgi:hypothetical protein